MKNIKVITIVGARPQFIKAATVSRALAGYTEIEEVIVHTGQHFDNNMSQVFFEEMDIPKPGYHLGVANCSHAEMTGMMMSKLEPILVAEKPDFLLLYGDTNSTLAGAITAAKLGIKIVHVEAGLRSNNVEMPEEINRILTDRISTILFCPTKIAVENLEKEGYKDFNCTVENCGDVMKDGAEYYSPKAKKPLVSLPEDYVLLTIHRPENTDNLEKLTRLVEAVNSISQRINIVFPIHPRTTRAIEQAGLTLANNICLIEPQGYLQMIWLIKHSKLVMTDSGGLQKEAFFFAKYCITLREQTEWQELVNQGYNSLVGSDPELIQKETWNWIDGQQRLDFDVGLYGDGNAAQKIADTLLEWTHR